MFCFNCGKEIEDGSRFCFYCGQDQTAAAAPQPAAPVTDDTCEMPVITPEMVEPLSSEVPDTLVEEISRIMQPAEAAEPAPVAVEIPDIPEVPNAPIMPPMEFVSAEAEPMVQPPVQPAAPVYTPAAPAPAPAAPAPVYAPAAPTQPPRRKKTWVIWLVFSLVVLLAAGAVAAVLLLGDSGHEKALDSLSVAAFDGDFSRIEELAPAEYWNLYNGQISASTMTYRGDMWKFTILPARLQAQFGSKTSMHYDSFRMPSSMEVRSDAEASTLEQQTIKAALALYGISNDRVGEMRKLSVEVVITGMSNGIKQELCHPETLFAVEIDGTWYLMDEDYSFAVNELVESILEEIN